jgi:cytochrome bd-type quinol oxidase subunit 2
MDAPAPVAPAEKSPVLLEIGSVLLLVLVLLMTFARGAREAKEVSEHIGYTLAPLIILAIVYGIARLMGKAKTRRGRARLVFWTVVVMFVGQCSGYSRMVQERSAEPPSVETGAAPAQQ